MNFEQLFTKKYNILNIKNKMLGVTKKVSDQTRDAIASVAQADVKRITASKKIIEAKEIKEIKAAQIALSNWVRANALPADEFVREGCYFLHIDLVEEFETKHAETCMEIEGLVNQLKARWEEIKEESKQALGNEWADSLLPSPEYLDAEFGVEYSIVHLSIPDNLSPESYQRQLDSQNQRLKSAYAQVNATLVEQLKTLLGNLKSRCDEYETGKGRSSGRFHKTLLSHLIDYTKRFDRRNLTENKELSDIVDNVAVYIEGLNIDDVKNDDKIRVSVSSQCEEFMNQLESLS